MQNDLDAIEAKMREQIDHHMSAYGDHAIEVMKFVPTLIAEVRALRTQLGAMREERDAARALTAESGGNFRALDEILGATKVRAQQMQDRAETAERERDEARAQLAEISRRLGDYDLIRALGTPEAESKYDALIDAASLAPTAKARDERLIAAERARADAAEEASRCLRAALWLCAYEEAFPRSPDGGMFLISAEPVADIDGDPVLIVLANDTFDYACADGEPLALSEAPDLLAIGRREGWPGIVRWVQTKRQARGEKSEPIKPVQESMDRISIAIATAEQAGFARCVGKVCAALRVRAQIVGAPSAGVLTNAADDFASWLREPDRYTMLSPHPAAPSPAQPVAVGGVEVLPEECGDCEHVCASGDPYATKGSCNHDAAEGNEVRLGRPPPQWCPLRASALAEHGKVRR